ncbi:hypothetical protein SASPL_121918 [Salvia splendens]|uniref:Ferrochelatase n=1 Tax=Salvia splendens TaxID=180675 RepID=A0A8X8XIF5_SALSN|nr:hypothetical protein SASPL_121918 [Salvia splendens]
MFLLTCTWRCVSGTLLQRKQFIRNDEYLSGVPVAIIQSWYQREGYIKSMADLIEKRNYRRSQNQMSAHGVPVSYVESAGDPYRDQMEDCIFLIMQELKARGVPNAHTLAYQDGCIAKLLIFSDYGSRVGPVQWLKPYTDEVLVELGKQGIKSLLAVPVSFVSEDIETLEEIDMEYKELALESGIIHWGRVPALNCTSSFINDMADAVIEALPSAMAISPSAAAADDGLLVKLLFGSILPFFLFLSPKLKFAFKN